ncbi:M96 mating-specific protein family [Phytophthora cinnamomi]|uniref:M96 mating-specific protein family n=1 Tax=Phytophthora cinnamomi TaxID=4785 RepID=UPI00355A2679|nr:M96 mating-specific protein family [Phytophthora cinnamomi]
MAARRETRSDHEAFLVLLQGRSAAERQRLMVEYRVYLNGERDKGADFGQSIQTAGTAAHTAVASAARPATALRPRLVPAPPRGKNACYLAKSKRPKDPDFEAEAAPPKKAPGKTKMTKRQEAAIHRAAKIAKEARALARAAGTAAARAAAKEISRARMSEEEKRGNDARQAALLQLEQKKAATKRKVAPKPSSTAKQKPKKTSPHVADPEDEGDADDESVASSPEVTREYSASDESGAYEIGSGSPQQVVR